MPTKKDLENENSKLKELLNNTSKILSSSIARLFNDIQNGKPAQQIIKEEIKQNPFLTEKAVKAKAKTEPKVKRTRTSKWEFYNKIIHYAADENTPLKRRTLDYLVTKIPFSAKAIDRQVYRLGYKWRNGKVACA